MEVTLFPVVHDTPTYGMRIRADGKTFVYSCDTRAEICEESLDLMRDRLGEKRLKLYSKFESANLEKRFEYKARVEFRKGCRLCRQVWCGIPRFIL